MKKIIKWFKKQIAWFTSKKVLAAINEGLPYDEVEKIAEAEAQR